MEKVDGGYRVTARKIFGSGSPMADLMITSARYEHPEEGDQVLHFPLSMVADGVRILDDWNSFGMRGTGSNTLLLENVFVPDEAIVLTRPTGVWPAVWSMVVTVAFPVFLAPYVGVLEHARNLAVAEATKKWERTKDPHVLEMVGELDNLVMEARVAWEDMIRSTNDYEFENSLDLANRTLIQKGILSRKCIATVQKAMEVAGGKGFHRDFGLEQLLRDVMAAAYHPLHEKKQEQFSGLVALGRDPISQRTLS